MPPPTELTTESEIDELLGSVEIPAPKEPEPPAPPAAALPPSQIDDTRIKLLEETVELRRAVEAFTASMTREMAGTKELVGRLKDRIDQLHDKQNKIGEAWEAMRSSMTKHHLEQSTGATSVGAVVRKCNDRLEVMEKSLALLTDPHKVINPLKVQVAQALDTMTATKASLERLVEATKTEIYDKTAELRRVGKARVS